MDDTADARRARLAALRARAETTRVDEATDADGAGARTGTTAIAFRNYVPRDGDLASLKVTATTAPALAVPSGEGRETVALTLEPNVGDVDPSTIAPRRANWDLKRDVARRLEKLEKRTRRALVDIAREEEGRRQIEG